jgi:hypothetical protein
VGQDLTNAPSLAVPSSTHTETRYRAVLRQLGPDRCDAGAPAGARAYPAQRLGQGHRRPERGNDMAPLVRREEGVLVLVQAPLVCREEATGVACSQRRAPLPWRS